MKRVVVVVLVVVSVAGCHKLLGEVATVESWLGKADLIVFGDRNGDWLVE